MSPEVIFALGAVFLTVALLTGGAASWYLSWNAPERKRLRQVTEGVVLRVGAEKLQINETLTPMVERLARVVPKSPKELGRVRRRLMTAGYRSMGAAVIYSAAEVLLPVLCGGVAILVLGMTRGALVALIAAALGFFLPSLWLAYRISLRQKEIRNGLPDALDLFIVCIEAGSSLDQAIVKTGDELAISYPALADELRLLNTETRAGKPRMEAFKNFAARTKVDDVRSLVAMLVQTDRFGTSIAQALRTHAEVSRTKRRQRAEEKAAKLGVKLIFPLVFCLFPAFFVVTLGPAVIQYFRVFKAQIVN